MGGSIVYQRPSSSTSAILIPVVCAALAIPAQAAKVKVGDDPTLGDPEAKLVLLEFADYQ